MNLIETYEFLKTLIQIELATVWSRLICNTHEEMKHLTRSQMKHNPSLDGVKVFQKSH